MGPKWPLVLPIQPILRVPAGVLGVPGPSGLNFFRFFIDLVSKTSKNLPQIQLKIKFFNVVFKDWYKIADFEKHRKNQGFSQVFPCFISSNHIRRILNFCNNYEKKRLQNRVSQTQLSKNHQKPANSCFGSSLGHFGKVWALLGRILAVLGRLLGALGRSWAPLGCLLGVPWAVLGVSWVPLGPLGRLLGASWTIWDRFSKVSGRV